MDKLTSGARSALAAKRMQSDRVTTRAGLRARDCTPSRIRAQLAAQRWQQIGRAIVLHDGPMTTEDRWHVALANLGPTAVLTAFTAAEVVGLEGWERSEVHVLVPRGARSYTAPEIEVRLHRAADWGAVDRHPIRPLHRIAPALVRAASEFRLPRPACGILAAGVQQRLTTADRLLDALRRAPRARHRAQLLLAAHDIAQGAQALSEIDFVRLCRRHGIPTPEQQYVRPDRHGRRRYLDAVWRRGDGRLVVAEIDGALHLAARRWWDDQLRQNDVAIDTDGLVLRYPSVVVRTEEPTVVDQLRRALLPPTIMQMEPYSALSA